MPVPDVPNGFITPIRDAVEADAKNSFLVRQMQADPTKTVDVGPKSFPDVASKVIADIAMPIYANDLACVRSWLVRNTFGARLDRLALEKLGPEDGLRREAIGASGYIEATKIETGGADMDENTTLVHQPTGLRFRVVAAATYADGDPISIVGIDTGPDTNLDALAELVFESQPPGCSLTATVLEQNDGTGALVGLTGGRLGESDTELQNRILEAQANPPAAGNDAHIVRVAQRTATVPVEKAFTYSAWFGPASTAVVFTLRPDAANTRIPNSTQRGLVEADLRSAFAVGWTLTVPAVFSQALAIAVGVTWLSSARGWTDLTPWPEYIPGDPVTITAVTSSLVFRATTGTSTTTPAVGQTIGLYTNGVFKRKRISAVSVVVANKSWNITCTADLGASESYLPSVGQLVSPWSPSLNRLPTSMLAYTRRLGPGEMFASLPDPGGRRRRWPFSPDEWSSVVTNEGIVNATKASGVIADVEALLPATPNPTTVGTPGVGVYLQTLSDFAAFPQT